MPFHISKVSIQNYRNFHDLSVDLFQKTVLVGENGSGKSNFINALRLVLDPSLPDTERYLEERDFWNGLSSPMQNKKEIIVSVEFQGFLDNDSMLCILGDFLISEDTARVTYRYFPNNRNEYEFIIFGGLEGENNFDYRVRKDIPLQILPPLRNAEHDLSQWRRSPLKPLINRFKFDNTDLSDLAENLNVLRNTIGNIPEINSLQTQINTRINSMVGENYSVNTSIGIGSTDTAKLIKSLRLYVDEHLTREIGEESLGICNVLYIALLMLNIESQEQLKEIVAIILAIEEPEAHLHPHLQRLVYRDFFLRTSPLILTTHSPHIVSVSPIKSLVNLKKTKSGTRGFSSAQLDISLQQIQDLERYIDATRGEIVFAKGVILVEGIAELYLVPRFAEILEIDLDASGITVCSAHGTDFKPYVKFLNSLGIPFVIITDGDPEIQHTGYNRCLKLIRLTNENAALKFEKCSKSLQIQLFTYYNIYMNESTLEKEIGTLNKDTFLQCFNDFGKRSDTLTKLDTALNTLTKKDSVTYLLTKIEEIGKGRFAQRLASYDLITPKYISKAIQSIVKWIKNS